MSEGHYADINGLRFYYETSGKGTPVIFIHTAGTDGRIWKHFVDLLPEKFTSIIVDLPGHGKSWPWAGWRKTRVNVSYYTNTVAKFIESQGYKQVIVVGCSVGAVISLQLARLLGKKVKLAAVIEGAGKTHTFEEETILKTVPGDVERAFDFCGTRSSKQAIEELLWIRSSNNRDIYVTDLLAWNNFDITAELGKIDTDVLLIRGEEDPVVTERMASETANQIRNARYMALPGFGHYPMIEDPEELVKILLPEIKKAL
ncbi:hypothetical protein IX51_03500 [uncultured archaeon]|nr:hypothetical protein IX51_03500 [uncultured archaeon]